MMRSIISNDSRHVITIFNRNGLINHALLFRVITHFYITNHGEIFTEWVANKAIIRE